MTKEKEILALDIEIAKLKQKRGQLLKSEKENNIEIIKELSWLKDYHGCLCVDSFNDYDNNAKYFVTIRVIKDRVPFKPIESKNLSNILIMGEKLDVEKSVLFSTHDSGYNYYPAFYTSKVELMIEFLKIAPFGSFEYDKDQLLVLKACEECCNAISIKKVSSSLLNFLFMAFKRIY